MKSIKNVEERKEFKEALKYLGEKVGVNVSGVQINRKTTKYDKLYDAYKLALKYYQNNLNSSVGIEAKKYLNSSISEEIRTIKTNIQFMFLQFYSPR